MKLSQLLRHKQLMDDLQVRPAADMVHNHLGNIVNSIRNSVLQFGDHTEHLENSLEGVEHSLEHFDIVMQELRVSVQQLIRQIEPTYFAESYRLYEHEMPHETTDYILNRHLKDVTEDVYEFVRNRVRHYDDWHHSGMVLRPGKETFIQNMVSCDPLYIVDQNYDLLRPCLELFDEPFQNRLRQHIVRESIDHPMMPTVPDGQLGFVLAYNIFNFRPLEILKRYLEEIYIKLKPGGTLAMTFNNCDLADGVALTEIHFMCYTPGMMVEQLARTIGYEVHFRYDTHVPNTWLELRKPGQLTSLKGGQALARINNLSDINLEMK